MEPGFWFILYDPSTPFCGAKNSEGAEGHNIQRPDVGSRLGVSHLSLLFTTVTCNYSRVCNSVFQKFTEKKKQDGEMHRSKIAVYCDPEEALRFAGHRTDDLF